jgi:hypothetical protein
MVTGSGPLVRIIASGEIESALAAGMPGLGEESGGIWLRVAAIAIVATAAMKAIFTSLVIWLSCEWIQVTPPYRAEMRGKSLGQI